MGLNGYRRLLEERSAMLRTFPERLGHIAKKYGERLLICEANTISFGITLDSLPRPQRETEADDAYLKAVSKDISSFGAMLFSRCVSGTRAVPRAQTKIMNGEEFLGFGSSTANYHSAYMTAACAIGVSKAEIADFFVRLDRTFAEHVSKRQKAQHQ